MAILGNFLVCSMLWFSKACLCPQSHSNFMRQSHVSVTEDTCFDLFKQDLFRVFFPRFQCKIETFQIERAWKSQKITSLVILFEGGKCSK